MRTRLVPIIALALVSCGGSDEGPTGPNTPTPTLTSLTIAPAADFLKIRQSETFTLTATMSDGSSRPMSGTWTSDAPAVAAVEPSGRVTGVASGEATIAADSQGARATRRLRVVPDYQGRWSGDWSLAGCSADGDWARAEVCREAPIGSREALTLTLEQDRDAVSGDVDLGDLPGPVRGSIRGDGQLSLEGSFTVTDDEVVLEIVLTEWQTVTTDNQRMTGRFAIVVRAAGIQGSVRIEGDLRVVGRTSTGLIASTRAASAVRRALSRIVR